jgi:hypothetical protein
MTRFSPEQMISLRKAAKGLQLVNGSMAAYVAGDSAAAVRAITGPLLAKVDGITVGVPQKVGARYIARLPRSVVRTMSFLPWLRPRPVVATSPSQGALLQLMSVLRGMHGPAAAVAPRQARSGKWVFVIPAAWSRGTLPHVNGVTYLRPAGSATAGIPNAAGQSVICGAGSEPDINPFSDTFGECVPVAGADDEDVINPTQECGPGQHFDEFSLVCVCDDPAAMVGPNGGCILAPCPPGSHHEAGVCVDDVKPGGGGGGGTVVTTPPPGTTPPVADDGGGLSEDTMLLIAAGGAVVIAVGAGIYFARKKKGKRKR